MKVDWVFGLGGMKDNCLDRQLFYMSGNQFHYVGKSARV